MTKACVYEQVTVKVLSAHDATAEAASSAEQEIQNKARAAQACSKVVGVFGHCTKDQHVCLVVLPYEDLLVTLVEGKLAYTQLHGSALKF